MKAFYIGSLYPLERLTEIRSNCNKGSLDNAANNFQWALLDGLNIFYNDLKVITLPSIRSFPKYYKFPFFKKSIFAHKREAFDYCLGFITVFPLSHLSRYLNLRRTLVKIIPKNEESILIIYAVSSPFLKAVADLKSNGWNKMKTCLIVPDLPQFMSGTSNLVYRSLKLIDTLIIQKNLSSIDSFVLLSKFMADVLPISDKPWVVVEGIYSESDIDKKYFLNEPDKTILYSGGLSKRYGIMNLLNAFHKIESNDYHLWICGSGDAADEIEQFANKDSRITFWGQLSFNKVLELQRRATILINPRSSKGLFTKYSFPSKTMEYLASGTPTIMHRLPGIPVEYFNYCFVCENETSEDLKDMILNVCNLSNEELQILGSKAKEFILENKSPRVQVMKIYNMISQL